MRELTWHKSIFHKALIDGSIAILFMYLFYRKEMVALVLVVRL